jgi:hypothetical protein
LAGNDQAVIFAPQLVQTPLHGVSLNRLAALCRDASAARYQALHRADRLLATANGLAAQRHKHFVKIPCGAGLAASSRHAMSKARAKLVI